MNPTATSGSSQATLVTTALPRVNTVITDTSADPRIVTATANLGAEATLD